MKGWFKFGSILREDAWRAPALHMRGGMRHGELARLDYGRRMWSALSLLFFFGYFRRLVFRRLRVV